MSSLRCFGDWWLCPPLGGHFLGNSPSGLARWPVDLDGGGDDGGLPGRLQTLGDAGAEEQRGVSLLWADGNSERSRRFRCFFGWVFLMSQMFFFPFLGFSWWFIDGFWMCLAFRWCVEVVFAGVDVDIGYVSLYNQLILIRETDKIIVI